MNHERGPVAPEGVQRIKTRAQFQAVLGAATVSRTAHFALHRLSLLPPVDTADPRTNQDKAPQTANAQDLFAFPAPWIGTVVPKRWARRAVMRNTIKRQIHAVAREFAPRLSVAAHVVRLRTGFDRAQFTSATSPQLRQAVRSELHRLFEGASR